ESWSWFLDATRLLLDFPSPWPSFFPTLVVPVPRQSLLHLRRRCACPPSSPPSPPQPPPTPTPTPSCPGSSPSRRRPQRRESSPAPSTTTRIPLTRPSPIPSLPTSEQQT